MSVETVCSIWPATSYSKRDTDATIRGNRVNNARREGFCEGTSAASQHSPTPLRMMLKP